MNQAEKNHIDYLNLFKNFNTPCLIFGVDEPNFTILDENYAHATAVAVKREDVIGRPLLEAFPPDTTQAYRDTSTSPLVESIRRTIKSKKPDYMPHLQYYLIGADGKYSTRYWSLTHYPLIENNKVAAVYQMSSDITDEVLNEQRLALAEHQLTRTLSGGSIGTWSWDIANGVIVADANLAKMFGLNPQSTAAGLQLEVFMASIYPPDRARVENELKIVLENRSIYQSEYRTIGANGDIRWVIVRGNVESDKSENAVLFVGVVMDITERKQAENNLKFLTKASAQFSASLDYRKTLGNIAAMTVPEIADWCTVDMLDDSGHLEQIVVAHKDAEKIAWAEALRAQDGLMMGVSDAGISRVIQTGEPEMYSDVTDEMLVESAQSEDHLQMIRELGISSVIITPLIIDKKPIGAMTFVATESRIHYNAANLEVAVGLANRAALAVYNARLYNAAQAEIKKRKHLQKELQTLNVVLEERVAIRTKELEATNKGLKTEINRRQGAERELKKYSKSLAASNQELENFAYVASHDLQEPLRKIRAFGDILESEFGEQLGEGMEYLGRMRRAASRMSTLIDDLLEFSRVSTRSNPLVAVDLNVVALEVVSDLDDRIKKTKGIVELGQLPVVWAEQTHMRQLLQNIIGNALKFHREGVAPVVTVKTDPIDPLDNYYTIYIIDNGIGFEEKYLDRIFSVFQRLHSKDVYEGTGIGLAICRKIALRYGGSITATSKQGVGSEFIFKIPIMGKERANGSS